MLADRYRQLGESFLDEVRGEFAVTLQDPERGVLLGARDGWGSQYLSFREGAGGPVFAPDDSHLVAPPPTKPELEPLRLAEFFAIEEVSGAQTFFRDVRAVLPGEMVWTQEHANPLLRTRALPRPRLDFRLELSSWEEYVERFAELLRQAVERSIGNHDRVAVWLSGGLDSSPIAALAAREGRQVDALVWQVSGERGDETSFAAEAARHAGVAVSWIPCDDAWPFSDLARWPMHPSTPGQTAYRWFHQRSYERAAELGHSLVLNGFGGDMLYGNAKRWFWTLLAAQGVGTAIDRLREVVPDLGWWATIRSQVLSPLLPRRRILHRAPRAYLTPGARQWLVARGRWPRDLEQARRPRQAERLLALDDAHGVSVERYFAASFGLEVGTPLRDPNLVEFMLAVPDHLLQQGAETRPVLRAATRDLLPESVRRRRGKAGFQAVLERGFARENLYWAPALLLEPGAIWRDFVREDAVLRWLDGRYFDDWDRIGFLHCLYAELWRFRQAGGDLATLSHGRS